VFDLYCKACDRTYLRSARNLRRLEHTDCGPVGVAVCPSGHVTRVAFGLRRRGGDRDSSQRRLAG
jgi:hypothetical protein